MKSSRKIKVIVSALLTVASGSLVASSKGGDKSADQGQILELVTDIGPKVDRQDWEGVRNSFADQVVLDYTSLFGGELANLTPTDIVANWSGLTPGFDRTEHIITNLELSIAENHALARSHVTAKHVLVNPVYADEWFVEGEYFHELQKKDGQWKITKMRFESKVELGSRELVPMAAARVEARKKGEASYKVSVSFPNQGGDKLAGSLYLPVQNLGSERLRTFVITGSWSSVKEQNPEAYGQRLATEGYLALAFDHSGFGASEGEPRQVENPFRKVEDIKAAVSYLLSLKNVDPEQIIGVGICAGGGYMARATAEDSRVKGLVTVAGWFTDVELYQSFFGVGYESMLTLGQSALNKFKNEGVVDYRLAIHASDWSLAAMAGEDIVFYYGQAAGKWENRWANQSYAHILGFESIPFAAEINVPTLMIHGDKAISPDAAKKFFLQLGAQEKSELWIDGEGQIEFYRNSEVLRKAVDSIKNWSF